MKCPSAMGQATSYELCIMHQSVPSLIPSSPWANFQNLANTSHQGKLFCQMLGPPEAPPRAFLGQFISINFTLFHHFQDLSHCIQFKFQFQFKFKFQFTTTLFPQGFTGYLHIRDSKLYLSMKRCENCRLLN